MARVNDHGERPLLRGPWLVDLKIRKPLFVNLLDIWKGYHKQRILPFEKSYQLFEIPFRFGHSQWNVIMKQKHDVQNLAAEKTISYSKGARADPDQNN